MAIIDAYTFTPEPVVAVKTKNGGFDTSTNALTPMQSVHSKTPWPLHAVLDNITLAVEAGLIDSDKFVSQVFAKKKDFEAFLEDLAGESNIFNVRIYDRWLQALAALAMIGHVDTGETFVTAIEIAEALREAAKDTGQI